MGKRGGSDTATKQGDINDVLAAHGREGKVIVRLKGGDPLLFGRVADEVRRLRQEG
jgi:siroheme synthase